MGGAGSSFGERAEGLLSNLPFPREYLFIVLGAIVLAILIFLIVSGVSRCSASNSDAEANSADNQQAAQQEEPNLNPDISEDLRWRDTDFAVDPARTTWNTKDNGRKVVYLTIDDGPSELTEKYLDLFDQYNCKVTFFVTGHDPNYYNLIHEAYKRGHTIGLHSMTHDYETIYKSEDAFFSDLDAVGQIVKQQIGYVPCFIRFPGGSSNTISNDYSKGLMARLVTDVQQRGYQYYDWNAAIGDGADLTTQQLIETTKGEDLSPNVILLAHDSATKQTTLEALPSIIEYYQNLGYTFEAIDRNTMVSHHTIYTEDELNSATSADTETGEDGEEYDEEALEDVESEDYYTEDASVEETEEQ